MRKTCSKCGLEKELADFYKRHAQCKKCRCTQTSERHKRKMLEEDWLYNKRERQRLRYHAHKENHRQLTGIKRLEADKRHFKRYPEKYYPRSVSSKIKRPFGFVAHHWSYDIEKAEDVILLEKNNHYLIHRFLKYDQPNKMYKTRDGELLDTRENHEAYINQIIKDHAAST